MKLIYLIITPYLLFANAFSADFDKVNRKAEAFLQARDFDEAKRIYEKVWREPLESWQKAILLYNLGTIKLAQNNTLEALEYFKQIDLNQATSPQFIRSIYFNEGYAYLDEALYSMKQNQLFDLIEASDLFKKASRQFRLVDDLDCELQKIGAQDTTKPCVINENIQKQLNEIEVFEQLSNLHTTLALIPSNKPALALNILKQSLKKLSELMQIMQGKNTAYIYQEAQKLNLLWNKILPDSILHKQEEVIKTHQRFQNLLEKLKDDQADGILKITNELFDSLNAVSISQEQLNWEKFILNLHLTISNRNYSPTNIDFLRKNLSRLKNQNLDQKIANYFNKASEEAAKNEIEQTEFYLTGILALLEGIYFEDNLTNIPLNILNRSWILAKQNLRLMETNKLDKEQYVLISYIQNTAIKNAKKFIPSVLEKQKSEFTENGVCQKYPWENVIPLFLEGNQSILMAKKSLTDKPKAIQAQEDALLNWKKALSLINQPSVSFNQDQGNGNSNEMNDLLRKIQEMHVEDQPSPEVKPKEMSRW